jgi:SAM-dependent methyltransferase
MDLKWYQDFFEGIAVDVWRKAVSPEQTRTETDFLQRALRLQSGERVLDVPCGFGRHSLELASRGFRPTGVDASPQMIEEARAGAASAGLTIDWRLADMRALSWESEFDAAFCFGNAFGYLDTDGTREFVQAVSRALKAGGRFAFDYGLSAEGLLPRFRDREWAEIGDILFLERNKYHVRESCVETAYTFVREGETVTRIGWQWVYTIREIRRFLSDAGLHTENLFRSVDGEPFEMGSPNLVLLAQKVDGHADRSSSAIRRAPKKTKVTDLETKQRRDRR